MSYVQRILFALLCSFVCGCLGWSLLQTTEAQTELAPSEEVAQMPVEPSFSTQEEVLIHLAMTDGKQFMQYVSIQQAKELRKRQDAERPAKSRTQKKYSSVMPDQNYGGY